MWQLLHLVTMHHDCDSWVGACPVVAASQKGSPWSLWVRLPITQASGLRVHSAMQRGKWVPPSKAEAERMMGQLSQMGPDEGV